MPDFTMCRGTNCNLRRTCQRFMPHQSVFAVNPNNSRYECEYYMPSDKGRESVAELLRILVDPDADDDDRHMTVATLANLLNLTFKDVFADRYEATGTYIGNEPQFKGRHAHLIVYGQHVEARFDTGWERHSRLNFPVTDWELDAT